MGGIEKFKEQSALQIAAFEKLWEEEGKYFILGAEPHDMAAVWFAMGVSWQKDQQDTELNIKPKAKKFLAEREE